MHDGPTLESAVIEPSEAQIEYRAMFDAQFTWACRTLRRLGVRDAELEDAAQDTFVAVHRKWSAYDRSAPLRPWLFGFAFRIASNYRRRERNTELGPLDPETCSALETPEEAALGAQAKSIALDALQMMSPDRRDVLVMHDLEGFGAPAVAECLSIPVNTVYSRLRVARVEFESAVARLTRKGGKR